VALETTLLVHGVPRHSARTLADALGAIVRRHHAEPAFVGLIHGRPTVGLTDEELARLLDAPEVPKANTANLGVLIHRHSHGATTIATTVELAARAGIRFMATGGLGGVHRGYGTRLDISGDLAALARHPVAVVCSGVKSLLDVPSTREALETLGVPVVGYRTDSFPAFYCPTSEAGLDATFDDEADLAAYLHDELIRTGRGIVVANLIPNDAALNPDQVETWVRQAEQRCDSEGISGRDRTPYILKTLHEVSGGQTLRANLALVRANTDLAARLCGRRSNNEDGVN